MKRTLIFFNRGAFPVYKTTPKTEVKGAFLRSYPPNGYIAMGLHLVTCTQSYQ